MVINEYETLNAGISVLVDRNHFWSPLSDSEGPITLEVLGSKSKDVCRFSILQRRGDPSEGLTDLWEERHLQLRNHNGPLLMVIQFVATHKLSYSQQVLSV